MKRKFLSFLRKYWFCFLLSAIILIGLTLSIRYADLYQTGTEDDMIRFNLYDLYLIYGIPLCSFVYGCLTYIILKKVWIQQLILFATFFIHWFIYGIEALFWEGTYIISAVPVFFSLVGASITAVVCYIVKSAKEYKD